MNIARHAPEFSVDLATSSDDLAAIQRLRYDVFVTECGAAGMTVDHKLRVEADKWDAHADHLVLRSGAGEIVGAYRLMRTSQAAAVGGFYSATEFDLTPLLNTGETVLELSRSCIHPAYRGGTALLHLWQGLSTYAADHDVTYLFGVASFSGTDTMACADALTWLSHNHLAPKNLRPTAIGSSAIPLTNFPLDQLDRRHAMLQMPALIKAYLRMGGVVGDGAFVDQAFGTIDVCMILDAAQLSARQRAFLGAD